MLSDRSYMRDSYGRTTTSTLTWMLCALTAGFLIQTVFIRAFGSSHFTDFVGFTPQSLSRGWLWTLVTYPLLHQNVLLLLGNSVSIFFLTREVIPLMTDQRFTWFAVAATALGAFAWMAVHHDRGDVLMGATPLTSALLVLFACLYPDRTLSFLFFFLPVSVKPKFLAWGWFSLSALGLALSEIPSDRLTLGIAHSAHLGGMLVAVLYYRFVHLREWRTPDGRAEIELPAWLKKTPKSAVEAPAKFTVNIHPASRETLKAEVDRILDKINSEGFAALTADEKRLLDDARDQISRR